MKKMTVAQLKSLEKDVLGKCKIKLLLHRRQSKVKLLLNRRHFAISNNPYKKGDIIEDHFHIIKIETLIWSCSRRADGGRNNPFMKYYGTQLKKDLTPCVIQENPEMFQINVVRKLN
jgi:hypothetical protein